MAFLCRLAYVMIDCFGGDSWLENGVQVADLEIVGEQFRTYFKGLALITVVSSSLIHCLYTANPCN